MSNCTDLIEALERHLARASAPDESARVEAHLRECPECRAYAETAARIEQQVRTHVEGELAKLDPQRLKAKLEQGLRVYARTRRWAVALCAVALAAPLLAWAMGESSNRPGLDVAACFALALGLVVALLPRIRRRTEVLRAADTEAGMVAALRWEARRRARGARIGRALCALITAGWVVALVVGFRDRWVLALPAVVWASASVLAHREARQARAELQELG